MKMYLAPRMRPDRAAENELAQSDSNLALINLFQQAANQAGTVGGRTASSAPLDQLINRETQQNQIARQQMGQERKDFEGDQERRVKIMQYLQKQESDAEQKKYMRDLADKKLGLQERGVIAQERAAAAKGEKDSGANEGAKALDRDYAKDYNDWTSTGRAGYDKNINLLSAAKKELEDSKDDFLTSGNVVGRVPDALRTEKARLIQQKVQAAAQGAMKAALGSAFTEREGERIMNLSYDPTLSPEKNLEKIDEAIADLKQKAANQEGKARYFEKNQSLRGYVSPTASTIGNQTEESAKPTPTPTPTASEQPPPVAKAPPIGTKRGRFTFIGGDPKDQANWKEEK